MSDKKIPEFAVVGHPNEGKSAVVSTLAEDDSVRVSPFPGETVVCRTFPVRIDGKEIIRFTDTPGFQNPNKVLGWMRDHEGDDNTLKAFLDSHEGDPDYQEDCELLRPILRGAGVIFVVDGSRPLRKADLAEMEILRLTGCSRMAIINCKEEETGYLDKWKNEFRKHFNAIRIFNAHRANYAERIDLLENLKGIDQEWAEPLDAVINAFKQDWEYRNLITAEIILNLIEETLKFSISKNISEGTDETRLKERLMENFNKDIERIEKKAREGIRSLFKHNIFNYDLPSHSILHEDIFAEMTWQALGLNPKQLIAAAGMAGGAIGAALDVAVAGLTFGVFTVIGGLAGAGWTALGGGKRLAGTKVVGLDLGGRKIKIGPVNNIQFMYVLIDRVLIFYSHIINWAHGRRDYPASVSPVDTPGKIGFTSQWDSGARELCRAFYNSIRSRNEEKKYLIKRDLKKLLQGVLLNISGQTTG